MHYQISIDRKQLTLFVDESERNMLFEMGEKIHSDQFMYEFFESLICNSELTWIYPDETGDLTDAPMLGILGEEGIKDVTVFLPNHGLRETGTLGHNTLVAPILERWAFMSYALRSLCEDLRDKGQVILIGE